MSVSWLLWRPFRAKSERDLVSFGSRRTSTFWRKGLLIARSGLLKEIVERISQNGASSSRLCQVTAGLRREMRAAPNGFTGSGYTIEIYILHRLYSITFNLNKIVLMQEADPRRWTQCQHLRVNCQECALRQSSCHDFTCDGKAPAIVLPCHLLYSPHLICHPHKSTQNNNNRVTTDRVSDSRAA